jgi:PAS domain S-box-containing protein
MDLNRKQEHAAPVEAKPDPITREKRRNLFSHLAISSRSWPLAVAMGLITFVATGLTMLLDDGVTDLLAPYPAAYAISDVAVFVLPSLLAMALYWAVIGRPIKVLTGSVQEMAEHLDNRPSPKFKSRLREMQHLNASIVKMRQRLIDDEQRAMRLARDMIQVAKTSGDWLWREDTEHRFTEILIVNPAVQAATEVEQCLGLRRIDIANHPGDRVALATLQQVIDSRGTFRDFRYRVVGSDEVTSWYSASGIPTFDEQGAFLGYRGTLRDVTDEMLAAENKAALEALNEQLAAAIAQSNDGVALVDPTQEGRPVVYVNAAFTRITRLDADAILGQSSIALENSCDDGSARERLVESIDSCRRYKGLIPTRRPDDSIFWNDLTVTPVLNEQNEVTGIVWGFSDVSAQVEQEQRDAEIAAKSAQNQKMEALGTLAGGIAHDLNNTLVPVLGLSKLLLNNSTGESPSRKPLQAIVSASERARGLVRQILDFSRAGSGELQPISLTNELTKAATMIRAAIASTAALDFSIPDEELWVLFDPGKLYQILMNLSANAFDALPDGKGHIRFVLEKDMTGGATADRVRLSIQDDGVGMSEETLQRAMEPFFTTKEVGKGTGLGLSIIHGIVGAVGGEILLSSTLGQGTCVEIFLPLTTQPRGEAQPAQMANTATSTGVDL